MDIDRFDFSGEAFRGLKEKEGKGYVEYRTRHLVPESLGENLRACLKWLSLLFLPHYFKWVAIGLLVHKLAGFRIPFYPSIVFWVKHLGSVPHSPMSMTIAFWRIRRHLFNLLFY